MAQDDTIYVAMNMHWDAHWFSLPGLSDGKTWHVFANTGSNSPDDIWESGSEPALGDQGGLLMGPRSVAILVGR
jgi:glycogen operon protein